ncbi:MAG: hypothetical protein JJT75_12345 [Opitutales bacterium]|nr:hypothetical protein [Opitutales bacterium]
MEKEAETEPPPFQYIITTTEPPPKKMEKEPWLLHPVLNSTSPEKHFLGVDIS